MNSEVTDWYTEPYYSDDLNDMTVWTTDKYTYTGTSSSEFGFALGDVEDAGLTNKSSFDIDETHIEEYHDIAEGEQSDYITTTVFRNDSDNTGEDDDTAAGAATSAEEDGPIYRRTVRLVSGGSDTTYVDEEYTPSPGDGLEDWGGNAGDNRTTDDILADYQARAEQRARFEHLLANETDPTKRQHYQDQIAKQNDMLADLAQEAIDAGIDASELSQIDAEAASADPPDPESLGIYESSGLNVLVGGYFGALEGQWHGIVMVTNALTLHQTPLNGYADNLIEENGGVYGFANGSANVGAAALYAAGGVYVAQNVTTFTAIVGRTPIAQELHVIYQSGTGGAWSHAMGHFGRMRISSMTANQVIDHAAGRILTIKLPILFPAAAAATGGRAYTCVTGAAHAFIRGWFPFL